MLVLEKDSSLFNFVLYQSLSTRFHFLYKMYIYSTFTKINVCRKIELRVVIYNNKKFGKCLCTIIAVVWATEDYNIVSSSICENTG